MDIKPELQEARGRAQNSILILIQEINKETQRVEGFYLEACRL